MGVKFVSSSTGRTLLEVVKGIMFQREKLEGGVENCAFEKNLLG
jgi:hypothetical protein